MICSRLANVAKRRAGCVGFLMGCCTGLMYGLQGVLLALLQNQMDVFESLLLNNLFLLIAAAGLVTWRSEPFVRKDRYFWLTCTLNSVGINLFFVASISMNFGDASAIYGVEPVFVAIVTCIILRGRYKCNAMEVMSAVLIVVGVFFVIQPPFIFKFLDRHNNDRNISTSKHTAVNNTQFVIQENSSRHNNDGKLFMSKHTAINTIQFTLKENSSRNDSSHVMVDSRNHSEQKHTLNESLTFIQLPYSVAAITCIASSLGFSVGAVFLSEIKEFYVATFLFQKSMIVVPILFIAKFILGGWTYPISLEGWGLLFVYMLSGFLAQAIEIAGIQLTGAAVVSIGATNDILFAYIFALLMQSKVPTIFSMIGAGIILLVTITLGFYQIIRGKRKQEILEPADDLGLGEQIEPLIREEL